MKTALFYIALGVINFVAVFIITTIALFHNPYLFTNLLKNLI